MRSKMVRTQLPQESGRTNTEHHDQVVLLTSPVRCALLPLALLVVVPMLHWLLEYSIDEAWLERVH